MKILGTIAEFTVATLLFGPIGFGVMFTLYAIVFIGLVLNEHQRRIESITRQNRNQ